MPAIQTQRENKGWTREELADAAGIAASTVWRAETGRHSLTQPILRKLAKALGCSVADLLDEGAA